MKCSLKDCKRSVPLRSQYACACSLIFCSKHKDPIIHACQFDFKAQQRTKLSKENPMIIGSKLNKI